METSFLKVEKIISKILKQLILLKSIESLDDMKELFENSPKKPFKKAM